MSAAFPNTPSKKGKNAIFCKAAFTIEGYCKLEKFAKDRGISTGMAMRIIVMEKLLVIEKKELLK